LTVDAVLTVVSSGSLRTGVTLRPLGADRTILTVGACGTRGSLRTRRTRQGRRTAGRSGWSLRSTATTHPPELHVFTLLAVL
jgi:hypothetical protein